MSDRMRNKLMLWLRVPQRPTPPAGAAESIRTFRAAKNYYKLLLFLWGMAQIGTIAGIFFSLAVLQRVNDAIAEPEPIATEQISEEATSAAEPNNMDILTEDEEDEINRIVQWLAGWPRWTLSLIHLAEIGALLFLLVQIPTTFFLIRLEYEQHWYIVTDRSLRVRTGLFSLKESTMSFANLQQVEVKQGPLQRLLKIADVRVQSAGGGSSSDQNKSGDSMHLAIFHGVDNAAEIRDLILDRLRSYQQAGLGDLDDAPPNTQKESGDAVSAAQELLSESRKLRQSLQT